MSTRGINFLHKWMSNNIPDTAKADMVSVDELTHKLIADAKAVGIKRHEIDEEVNSLYRTIVDAIVHFDPGSPKYHSLPVQPLHSVDDRLRQGFGLVDRLGTIEEQHGLLTRQHPGGASLFNHHADQFETMPLTAVVGCISNRPFTIHGKASYIRGT